MQKPKIQGLGAFAIAIEAAIYSILSDTTEITDLVSTRIYPSIIPQKAELPAISYQQIFGDRLHTMDGADGLVNALYQINCRAQSYDQLQELVNAVRKACDDYDDTLDGTKINVMRLTAQRDMIDMTEDVMQTKRYGRSLDYEVWFEE